MKSIAHNKHKRSRITELSCLLNTVLCVLFTSLFINVYGNINYEESYIAELLKNNCNVYQIYASLLFLIHLHIIISFLLYTLLFFYIMFDCLLCLCVYLSLSMIISFTRKHFTQSVQI